VDVGANEDIEIGGRYEITSCEDNDFNGGMPFVTLSHTDIRRFLARRFVIDEAEEVKRLLKEYDC
jgi:hypothetical protein